MSPVRALTRHESRLKYLAAMHALAHRRQRLSRAPSRPPPGSPTPRRRSARPPLLGAPGAGPGRPRARPAKPGAGVPHRRRPTLRGPLVAHVTVRLLPHVYQLRSARCWKVLGRAFEAARDRHGMRLCHYSIQRDHLHLIVEADHRDALSRGMLGLGIRLARGLNGCMRLRGRVLADRYHARLLGTPLEVRRALLYVLNNVRKHLPPTTMLPRDWIDPYSTAACFDGWSTCITLPRWGPGGDPELLPRTQPRLWLLHTGWRRHGALDPGAQPGSRPL
jgi:hypothetical protein